jgi:hypothetical protein
MSKTRLWIAALLVVALASTMVLAAGKTYQVTGPVLEVTNDKIVVQKGSEKWEIARDASTKVTGDLVVGAKVTITYTMTATSVEVKPATKSGTSTKPKH